MTLHAGEWPGSLENVREAVHWGVARIGHGLALAEDADLMQRVADEGITVECCPSANVGGGKVGPQHRPALAGQSLTPTPRAACQPQVASFAQHPLPTFLEAGINVTVNRCRSHPLHCSGSASQAGLLHTPAAQQHTTVTTCL